MMWRRELGGSYGNIREFWPNRSKSTAFLSPICTRAWCSWLTHPPPHGRDSPGSSWLAQASASFQLDATRSTYAGLVAGIGGHGRVRGWTGVNPGSPHTTCDNRIVL